MISPTVPSSPLAGLLRYFTRHRTAANLILVLVIALGLVAFPRLRAQFFPDVVFETVRVAAEWDGAGAADIDNSLVQVLNPELQNVEGVTDTSAVSYEGRAVISVEFETGWDMQRAVEDVKTTIDGVTGLPDDVDAPNVRLATWLDRVTEVTITGPVGIEQLGRIADEFTVRLFENGVSRTTIRGIAAPRTVVEVEQSQLLRNEITLDEIARRIGEEAKDDPSGEIGAAARVRTGIAKRTADEIEGVVVRSNPNGSKLHVGDIASVKVEGADRQQAYFVGEDAAVLVRVDRSERGDAIAIQEIVEDVVSEMLSTLPAGVSMELILTRSEAITGRLQLLYKNGLLGLCLVVGMLFLFLSARVAFWVAAGVPTAMCAAIALMYAFGLSLNMVSLFGLIITLGIVVDDAIVVGEHADFRRRHLLEGPTEAAANAAIRMSAPVFAASITTIIAFFGLLVIGGRFGNLLADLAIVVVAVLIASLIECFLILPNHMRHALKNSDSERWYDYPSRLFNRGFVWFREKAFRPFVKFVLVFRYPTIAAAVLLLAVQATLFIDGDVRWRFFNAPELGSVSGNFAMAPNAERANTLEMVRELQRAAAAVGDAFAQEHGQNPITSMVAGVGGSTGRGLSGGDTKDADQLGSITIELIDADLRPYSSFEFVAALQNEVRSHPLMETLSFRGGRSGPGGDALDVQLSGADADQLKAAAEAVKTAVVRYPEVSAVEDDLAYDKQELVLELTPQGRALGFTIDSVGAKLRNRLAGVRASSYPVGTRTGEIIVQLPESERTPDFLERWRLLAPAGGYAPLTDIVSVRNQTGYSTVRRENGVRVVSVTGDISEDDPDRATEITEVLRTEILPTVSETFGVSWKLSGLAEDERNFLNDAMLGLLLVLTGIFLVMAWVFASWVRPFAVMLTIPFGLIGTIWGHYIWGVPLSMFSVIGIVGMSGIIINDSIILISTIDEYARTRSLRRAIEDACVNRLRPVLLTTATTVLGLAPLLYETSRQASFLKPTVITLVYGLGFGMVLILMLVPALIGVLGDFGRFSSSLGRSLFVPKRGRMIRLTVLICALLSLAWFAATLGHAIWFRSLPEPLLAVFGVLGSVPPSLAGLAVFLAGLLILCVLGYATAVLSMRGLRG